MRESTASRWVTVAAVCGILLMLIGLSGTVRADLPPRPDLPGPGSDADGAKSGAQILLRASFDADWPWEMHHGRELWTVVEWQDRSENWHPVEEWQGTLDDVEASPDGTAVGRKAWWVYEETLGQGPFRWAVYETPGSQPVAVSEPFNLPAHVNQSTTIELKLAP